MRIELMEPAGESTPELVSDVLSLVSVRIPAEAMAGWTRLDLLTAYDWAMREHLHASDNRVRRRDKPRLVVLAELQLAGEGGS